MRPQLDGGVLWVKSVGMYPVEVGGSSTGVEIAGALVDTV